MNEERKPVSDTELGVLDNLGWHQAVREIRELRKDRERLDWLEKQEGSGLLSDDFGHWAVSGEGMQNIPDNQREDPKNIETTFFVSGEDWKSAIRDAIDAAMKEGG